MHPPAKPVADGHMLGLDARLVTATRQERYPCVHPGYLLVCKSVLRTERSATEDCSWASSTLAEIGDQDRLLDGSSSKTSPAAADRLARSGVRLAALLEEIFKESKTRANPTRTIQPKQPATPAIRTGWENFSRSEVNARSIVPNRLFLRFRLGVRKRRIEQPARRLEAHSLFHKACGLRSSVLTIHATVFPFYRKWPFVADMVERPVRFLRS